MTGSAQTPFPLGVMVGGPNGSDPAAQAEFNARFAAFSSLMGATPQFMDGFIDKSQPISAWVSNASWTAWSWRQSAAGSSVTPVIGLPMVSTTDDTNPDATYKAFAAGQYDDVLRGIVSAWAQQGYTNLYFRPGYEMNGTFMPWYAGSDPGTQADWVAAFQHIADVLHSSPDATVKVVWNPNVQSWNGSLDVSTLYPGDQYVDVVGADLYSPVYPRDLYDWAKNDGTVDANFTQWVSIAANREHYWEYPAANRYGYLNDGQGNSLSLQNLIDLAKAHGKPLALAETGAGGDGTQGPADDPAFPQWLASTLASSGVPIAFVNIWDLNAGDADWTFSGDGADRPQEAAAWAKYFGAQATASGGLVLDVSEDAWQGDAQFTVSVDGSQLGGTFTATASHGAGQTEAFAIASGLSAGTHQVVVTFLNDAYGGTASTDRNLYVDGLSLGGVTTTGAALDSAGPMAFTAGTAATVPTPVPTPATAPVAGGTGITLGSGPDSIVLSVSEDAWQGDAEFTVSVDGAQIGGVQTATASHAAGATQAFTLAGTFGTQTHDVAVTFLNDAYAGTPATDRNLYVDGVSDAGATSAEIALMSAGTAHVQVGSPSALQVGAGPDQILLSISEDAWLGDAQFTVSVDGAQVGGTLVATASHGAGQEQAVTVLGSFGAGSHQVTVDFLNDAYGGTASTDRNLYVDSVTAAGSTTITQAALMSAGPWSFLTPTSVATALAAGPDLTLDAATVSGLSAPGTSAAAAIPTSSPAPLVTLGTTDFQALIPTMGG